MPDSAVANCIMLRASRSLGSATQRGRCVMIKRAASSATADAAGFASTEYRVSMQCASAFAPEPAVSSASIDTVSSGSRIATLGTSLASRTPIRRPVTWSRTAPYLFVSAADPDVVGIAMIGSLGAASFGIVSSRVAPLYPHTRERGGLFSHATATANLVKQIELPPQIGSLGAASCGIVSSRVAPLYPHTRERGGLFSHATATANLVKQIALPPPTTMTPSAFVSRSWAASPSTASRLDCGLTSDQTPTSSE